MVSQEDPKDMFHISCSRLDDFNEAIEIVERHVVDAKWPDKHPVRHWLAAAGNIAATIASGTVPDWTDEQAGMEDWLENSVLPAQMLCRLAKSFVEIGRIAGHGQELQQMRDPGHFAHSEFLLYIAVRIACMSGVEVHLIRAVKSGKRPDLEVPAERYAIECTARTRKVPGARLKEDFEHASSKFEDYLAPPDRANWVGLLATDLGLCGSESLPNIGRIGPDLSKVTEDARANFHDHPQVNGLLITWATLEIRDGRLSPVFVSGRLAREDEINLPPSLKATFFAWPE